MALEWQPRYPDQLRRPDRRSAQSFVVSAQNLVPIPIPPPPTELTWQPTYPDRVPPRTSLRAGAQRFLTTTLGPPPIALDWLPTYPTQLWTRRLTVRPALFAPISGAILDIPIRGGWRPIYPAWNPQRRPVRTGAQIWLVDPFTLLSTVTCILIQDQTVTPPDLTDEAVTNPDLVGTVTVPTFLDEEFC